MLLGVLGGICVYGAVSPSVGLVRDEPQTLGEIAAIALMCGVLAGPPAALGLRYHGGEVFYR
jgi:hypothetical protein